MNGDSAEMVAQRDGLGHRLSTTPLSRGSNYATGVFLVALAVGGVVLILVLPSTGAGLAGSIIIGLIALTCAVAGIGIFWDALAFRGRNIYTHPHGLVAETKAGPLSLPYADLLVYREQVNHMRGNQIVRTEVQWRLERRDGTPCDVASVAIQRLGDFWETALAQACEVQAAPQATALAAGSTLTYGDVSFDGHRLRAPGLDAAWTEVKAVNAARGAVTAVVARDGRLVKELAKPVGKVGKIPNFPLFWQLFQQAFVNSRPGTSGSAVQAAVGPPTSGTHEVDGPGASGSPISPTDGSSASGSSGTRSL